MRLFKKIAIIGTGLIGGSLALAIKKNKLAKEVVGVSRHKSSLALAKRIGAIDSGSQELKIIKGADLVILATPVKNILDSAGKISRLIAKDCIVTDVGSTKEEISKRLEKIFPNYIGSHPLAGSEKRGVANACVCIFKDSLCVLTPTKRTKLQAVNKIKKLWLKSGSRVVLMSPALHDKVLSSVSHLPHIAAFSLIAGIPEGYFKFASGGLKDTTRIAASDENLWADIFLSNKVNLLKDIQLFQGRLKSIKSAIQANNRNKLISILRQAKEKREKLK